MRTILSEDFTSRMYVPRHDMHIHTCYCNHVEADATFENYISFATEMGLEYLGFAEHVGGPESAFVVERIRRDIAALDLPGGAPKILVGAELDADPHEPDGRPLAGELTIELDHTVLATHGGLGIGQPRGERLEVASLSEAEREHYGNLWLDWYQACIESGNYDILGHPLRSSLAGGLLSLDDRRTFARVAELFRIAGARGLTMELNCGWNYYLIRNGLFEHFVELMQEGKCGGLRFCISSDAHAMAHFWTTDLGLEAQIATNLSPIKYIEAAGLVEEDWLDPETFLVRRET